MFHFEPSTVIPGPAPLTSMVLACTVMTISKLSMGQVMKVKVQLSCYLFGYHLIANPGNKTDALSWPDPHMAGSSITTVNPLCNKCVYLGRWGLLRSPLILPASANVSDYPPFHAITSGKLFNWHRIFYWHWIFYRNKWSHPHSNVDVIIYVSHIKQWMQSIIHAITLKHVGKREDPPHKHDLSEIFACVSNHVSHLCGDYIDYSAMDVKW